MQDFFKQQAEWLNAWQGSQEKLAKQYAEQGSEWMESVLGQKKPEPDFFEGWFKSQGDLVDQFMEFSKRLQEMISRSFGDKLPPEVLKLMNTSFFEAFYKDWLANLELPGGIKNPLNLSGDWQQASSFLNSLLEKDNPFFAALNAGNFSEELRRSIGMLQGAWAPGCSVFGDALSGYQNLMTQFFETASAQNADRLAEGFEALSKELEKHLEAPKLGISRELAHEIAQVFVISSDFIHAFSKMARLVDATSRKAGVRFQSKLAEGAVKSEPVHKFSDFCALWAVEHEAVFLEVLGSEEFAKLQGEYLDSGHRLKIQWNKLAERVLEPTPIALKRDLDLAIKEIHQMKRDMKTFQREFKELQKEARAAREAQAVVEKDLNNAKAAEAAAIEEAKIAKLAEAAAHEEAKKAKLADVAVKGVAKQVKTADKAVKASPLATTKTKSKKV